MRGHADASFDAVIDKATFDAADSCGQGRRLVSEARRRLLVKD